MSAIACVCMSVDVRNCPGADIQLVTRAMSVVRKITSVAATAFAPSQALATESHISRRNNALPTSRQSLGHRQHASCGSAPRRARPRSNSSCDGCARAGGRTAHRERHHDAVTPIFDAELVSRTRVARPPRAGRYPADGRKAAWGPARAVYDGAQAASLGDFAHAQPPRQHMIPQAPPPPHAHTPPRPTPPSHSPIRTYFTISYEAFRLQARGWRSKFKGESNWHVEAEN